MLNMTGAVTVTASTGTFKAIFHRDYAPQTLNGVEVEGLSPALECRTSDVVRLALAKDAVLDIEGQNEPYRFKKEEAEEEGWSMIYLRR